MKKVSVRVKTEWPEAPESFFESQVEDDIECGKVTARSRGAVGPDPSKYCLV